LNGSNPTKLGRVKVATQTATYSLEANDIASITDIDNTPNKSNYIFWYVAPDDFAGADPDDLKNSYRFVTATFTVNYDNSLTETFTKKIQIVRPPLALVHGLGGDPSAWNNFTFTSPNSGLHIQYLSSNNYLFHEVFAIPILPNASFNTNAFGLVVPSISQPLSNTLQGVIKKMRDQGYAANKVDYVAHSMGGNVIRQTVNLFSDAFKATGAYASSPYKNYEKGFVHKIITLNTPNNGSPLADLVTQNTPYLSWGKRQVLAGLYKVSSSILSGYLHPVSSYDQFEATDALKDLEVGDPGIDMESTNIPSHLIAGDVFGTYPIIDPSVWSVVAGYNHNLYGILLNIFWECEAGKWEKTK